MIMLHSLRTQKSKVLVIVFLAFLLNRGELCGQEEHIATAKEEAEAFSLEASYAFPEYRMIAEISAEASPDSEFLFASKATMEILQTKDFRVESFHNFPKVFSDDRAVRSTEKGGVIVAGPFTKFERWERLIYDGRTFELLDDKARRKSPNFSEPIDAWRLKFSTACIQPFDWSIHTPTAYSRRFDERDVFKSTFGKDRLCVFATRKDGLLESHWLKPAAKIMGVRSVTFKNGVVVASKLHVYRKPIEIKNYDLKDGWPMITTDTTWAEQGGSPVPKTVVSMIRPEINTGNTLIVIASIKLFTAGDRAFDEKKVAIKELIDSTK
ncbi:MAG: hypothetical protein ABL921_17270 [Pirellula sp.]